MALSPSTPTEAACTGIGAVFAQALQSRKTNRREPIGLLTTVLAVCELMVLATKQATGISRACCAFLRLVVLL